MSLDEALSRVRHPIFSGRPLRNARAVYWRSVAVLMWICLEFFIGFINHAESYTSSRTTFVGKNTHTSRTPFLKPSVVRYAMALEVDERMAGAQMPSTKGCL